MATHLGIDLGTSGVRAMLIDQQTQVLATARVPLPASRILNGMLVQQPQDWWQAVLECLQTISAQHHLDDLQGLCIDGTSGTTLLTDDRGTPLSPALMYNDCRAPQVVDELRHYCPAEHPACSVSSALVKAWWLVREYHPAQTFHIQQQADWILTMLGGQAGSSDWNNAMKLGFDPATCEWPQWLREIDWGQGRLPVVRQPGEGYAEISSATAALCGLPASTRLHAGTTDGVAAFIASGARQAGQAVTSLGSTLVLKLCSSIPVTSTTHGVYSHRLDHTRWLAGGASNSGGAVLKSLFSRAEIETLSAEINPRDASGLDYYPLPSRGERFPVADPQLEAVMHPVPASRKRYLQAILEGIARIEKAGYDLLEELGADRVTSIRTTGGGAGNRSWTQLRECIIGRTMQQATHTEAAFGSALLAAGKL